jgi:hypothetical protein
VGEEGDDAVVPAVREHVQCRVVVIVVVIVLVVAVVIVATATAAAAATAAIRDREVEITTHVTTSLGAPLFMLITK